MYSRRNLLLPPPLIRVLTPVPDRWHVALALYAPSLSARADAHDLRYPIRVHPAADDHAALLAPCAARERASHHLALLALAAACVHLRSPRVRGLIFAKNETVAGPCLRCARLGRRDRVPGATQAILEVLLQVYFHCWLPTRLLRRADSHRCTQQRGVATRGAELPSLVFTDSGPV